jgi:hypothetical protein
MNDSDVERTPLTGELLPTSTQTQPTRTRWLSLAATLAVAAGCLIVVSVTKSSDHGTLPGGGEELLINRQHLNLAKKMTDMGVGASTTAGYTSYAQMSMTDLQAVFAEFKEQYGKKYSTKKEEAMRFKNFIACMARIDERNANVVSHGGTAIHGISVFADLSLDEMKLKRGYLKDSENEVGGLKKKDAVVPKHDGTLSASNWVDLYTTTGRMTTENQGDCGDCWAFSSTQQIESDALRHGLITRDQSLSVQQVVSCDTADNGVSSDYTSYGCSGGTVTNGYNYAWNAGGLVLWSEYPYVSNAGKTHSCKTSLIKQERMVVTVTNYYGVYTEQSMSDYILATGPLSVLVDSSTWETYQGGVFAEDCGSNVDHAVQIIGVDTEKGYWIVRNSWGSQWGVNGYAYVKMNGNYCDISSAATYTDVAKANA